MHFIANFDFAGFRDRSPPFEPIDFVLFEQKFDTFGVLGNCVLFIGLHLFPIHRRAFAFQTHGGKIVFGFMQHVRGVQQRFGWNAPDVQASTAKGFIAFNTCGLETKLSTSNCADIAAGAAADNDYVVGCHEEPFP